MKYSSATERTFLVSVNFWHNPHPKNKMRNVIHNTSIIKTKDRCLGELNDLALIAPRITTAILIVLFATRIVLKSFFSGNVVKLQNCLERLFLDDFNLLISAGLSEKYATSEPDIRAETKRRISSTTLHNCLKNQEVNCYP